jgi:hypothetical protein
VKSGVNCEVSGRANLQPKPDTVLLAPAVGATQVARSLIQQCDHDTRMRDLIKQARSLAATVQTGKARAFSLEEKRRLVAEMARHLNLLANELERISGQRSLTMDFRRYGRTPGLEPEAARCCG